MRFANIILSFALTSYITYSQELFPYNESASSIPKGVIGVHSYIETFNEIDIWRNKGVLRILYGATPKLSLFALGSFSNHHDKKLPYDLINHKHVGTQTINYAKTIQKGIPYKYRINGLNLFAKYRFLTIDGQKEHFRTAAFIEYGLIKSAHDEAEPNLIDDNNGYGGGIIITWLKNKFAASLTTGIIIPTSYSEIQNNSKVSLSDYQIDLIYGKAIKYNLSFGYLISPREYSTYNQTNWNVYLEFQGKSWESTEILQDHVPIENQSLALKSGHHVDVHASIQKIVDSDYRLDFSIGLPFIKKSYTHNYPIFQLGIQKYFF